MESKSLGGVASVSTGEMPQGGETGTPHPPTGAEGAWHVCRMKCEPTPTAQGSSIRPEAESGHAIFLPSLLSTHLASWKLPCAQLAGVTPPSGCAQHGHCSTQQGSRQRQAAWNPSAGSSSPSRQLLERTPWQLALGSLTGDLAPRGRDRSRGWMLRSVAGAGGHWQGPRRAHL